MASQRTKRKSRKSQKKAPYSQSGLGRFVVERPFKVGEFVQVELQESVRGINSKQRATLEAFELRRQGQARVIKYRGRSTALKLHLIDHLVDIRPVEASEAKKPRGRAKPSEGPTGEPTVTRRSYASGGGKSRLLEVTGAGQLRVEAQKESFALMWPSPLSAPEFFKLVKKIRWSQEGTASLVSSRDSGIKEIPVSKLADTLVGKSWVFVRVDFSGWALTWAREYRDPERSGRELESALEAAHEVSWAGTKFEADYLNELLEATALAPIAHLKHQLTQDAAETLAAYA